MVWQKSLELVLKIYEFTKLFPKEEQFGLTSQMKRAAVSIPSNIAEGTGRKTVREYIHFNTIALGSAFELETQLIVAEKLHFLEEKKYNQVLDLLTEIIKMLQKLISNLKRNLDK